MLFLFLNEKTLYPVIDTPVPQRNIRTKYSEENGSHKIYDNNLILADNLFL
jgi:hypothetical protein